MESRTGFLISQIKQVQSRFFQRLLRDCGVEEFNGPQGHILYVLWQKDEVPIVELSQKTGLALIVLTEKARDLQQKYDEVSQKMNEVFYKGFSGDEVLMMDSYLDRILVNLEQSERSAKK